jgi:hypothetical protein
MNRSALMNSTYTWFLWRYRLHLSIHTYTQRLHTSSSVNIYRDINLIWMHTLSLMWVATIDGLGMLCRLAVFHQIRLIVLIFVKLHDSRWASSTYQIDSRFSPRCQSFARALNIHRNMHVYVHDPILTTTDGENTICIIKDISSAHRCWR